VSTSLRFADIKFTPIPGDWGAQIGWLSVPLPAAVRGLLLHRVAVFRQRAEDGVTVTFGLPLVPGELAGSRYSCVTFDNEEHGRAFLGDLESALRRKHPELFVVEEKG
jgi:hypothetical protein